MVRVLLVAIDVTGARAGSWKELWGKMSMSKLLFNLDLTRKVYTPFSSEEILGFPPPIQATRRRSYMSDTLIFQ